MLAVIGIVFTSISSQRDEGKPEPQIAPAAYSYIEPEGYRIYQAYLSATNNFAKTPYDSARVIATVVELQKAERCPDVPSEDEEGQIGDNNQSNGPDAKKVCSITPYPLDTGRLEIKGVLSYEEYNPTEESGIEEENKSIEDLPFAGSSEITGSISQALPPETNKGFRGAAPLTIKKQYKRLQEGQTVTARFTLTARPIKVVYAETVNNNEILPVVPAEPRPMTERRNDTTIGQGTTGIGSSPTPNPQNIFEFEPLPKEGPYYIFTTRFNYDKQVSKTLPGLAVGDTIVADIKWNGVAYVEEYSIEGLEQITTNAGKQINPSIHGSKIVWEDYRNGNADIYLYDLEDKIEMSISTNPAQQGMPDIYENKIAFVDNRNSDLDVYVYDLDSGEETRITGDGPQTAPKIYKNRVYYIDQSDPFLAQLFEYDLKSGLTRKVAEAVGWPIPNYVVFDVFEDTLVFDAFDIDDAVYQTNNEAKNANKANTDIFGVPANKTTISEDGGVAAEINIHIVDLSSGTKRTLNRPQAQFSPSVWGNTVVWEDTRKLDFGTNQCVYPCQSSGGVCACPAPLSHLQTFDLQTNNEKAIMYAPGLFLDRAIIYGDKVATLWSARNSPGGNIYLYNLSQNTETIIRNDEINQKNIDIFENMIVAASDRTGNWDIFLYRTE